VDPTFTTHCPECAASLATATGGFVMFLKGIAVRLLIAGLVLGAGAGWASLTRANPVADVFAVDAAGASEAIDARTLRVGDCIMWPGSGDGYEFGEVVSTHCAAPHDAEVFAVVAHPAGFDVAYPGDEAISQWSGDACLAGFADYVGQAFEEASELDISFFAPTEAGWGESDDRVVQCLVHRGDGGVLDAPVRSGA
jgi:hypothetical protein